MSQHRSSKKEKPKDAKKILFRISKYLIPYIFILLFILIVSLFASILELQGPSLAGKAINEAAAGIGKVNFGRVYYYAKLMLAFYLASSLLSFCISAIMMNIGRRVARKMRNDVFNKLMELPVGYFDRHQAGDIISRVSYDIDVISISLSTDIVQIMSSLVSVIGSFIMMMVICPVLVIVMLISIPMAVVYTNYMGKKTRPLYAKRSAMYGKMNGFTEEMFSGQKTILAYAHENTVLEDFDVINDEAADAYYKADYYGNAIGPTVMFINNLALSLIGMFGSFMLLKELVTIGQISSFILYSRKFSGPINEMANIMSDIYSALAAAERVFRLLDEPEEVKDIHGAIQLTDISGDVKLNDIIFGYEPNKPIVKHFNLEADVGKLIAIVGPTGAGKTTIINLLMRFYDVDNGEVLVDGNEIRTVTRESLRHAYAMVLQDTWVFRGTIFENIAYGRDEATMEEVIGVAKAAKIHSFIMRLPHGYDTVISEDGGNISKGQKQLLTIARAMLYDAKMLILDEATSNVDTSTEFKIQKAMRKLMSDKTCFVIAHRLSTIQNADRIIVLDQGDVVEQGNHEELMQQKGFYYKLYASQFE